MATLVTQKNIIVAYGGPGIRVTAGYIEAIRSVAATTATPETPETPETPPFTSAVLLGDPVTLILPR